VVREMGSGEVHRLDPVAGFYHWRTSGLANKLFTAALVLGAVLAVLALGLGCSWAFSRLRSRLVDARLPP